MHFRTEERRIRRERMVAANTEAMDQTESWNEIEPLLDQAMDSLAEMDRLAILLRFFKENSMAEVAAGLGVSEAAAKMRVGRALEKLRTFFSSCGIACSVAGLLALLDQNAAASVPPSVTASILSQVGKLKAAAKIPATAASAPKMGLQMAGAILVVGMAVIFLGPKLVRSNRASTQRANPAVAPLANGTLAASLASAPDAGAQAAVSGTGLRLTVLDGETARPLSGVRVSASELHQKFGEWVTDENGKCEPTRPPPKAGDFYFSLRARHDGFATMQVSWSRFQHDEPSDIPAEYVLKMPRGIRVGGSVIDDEGRPLVGTQVRLFGHDASGGPPPRERAILNDGAEEFVTTDASGLWTFDRLPPEWDNVHFIVSAAGFLPADFVSDANDQGGIGQAKIRKEEFLNQRAVMPLRRGTYLLGHVLDENRQPIAGARVVQNFKWREAHALVTTGKDGAYEFFNAPTGSLTLSFQVEHYAPQTTNLTVDGPSTNAPVILAPGHVLRGRVIDADGSGVADAEVGVDAIAPGRMEFQWSTKTDIEGRLTSDGAPVDPASYAIYKPGFHGTQVVAADGSEQTVTVERIDRGGRSSRPGACPRQRKRSAN
jgi:protocatechuate 3,4-dioxygenase beta subunit